MNSNATTTVVSAPGKLMISGEYAVLEGAEAIVTAVSRRVRVWRVSDPSADAVFARVPPEAEAARAAAEQRFGSKCPGALRVDVRETRSGDQKLGVGSSAAAAAASAGLVAECAGRAPADREVRRMVLEAALRGHASVAPRGSGADVAAATLGGFIRFRKRPRGIECEPVRRPAGLEARVVWTGKQVRTSDMLDRVEALKQANPNRHVAMMDRLRSGAEAFSAAFVGGDAARVIQAARQYHAAMGALGEAAGIPIVDDTLARISALAQRAGGAAKPSGAGGGDVALALFSDGSHVAKFEGLCQAEGLHVVNMELGVVGIRVEA